MKATLLSAIFALSLSAQVLPLIQVQPEGDTQLCVMNDTADAVGYAVMFFRPDGTAAQPSFEEFGPQAGLFGGLVPQAIRCFKFAPAEATYWAVNTSPFVGTKLFLVQDLPKTKAVLAEQNTANAHNLPFFASDASTDLVLVNTGSVTIDAAMIYYSPGGVEVFRSETFVGPYQQVVRPLMFERLQGLTGTLRVLDTLNNNTLAVSVVRHTATSEVTR